MTILSIVIIIISSIFVYASYVKSATQSMRESIYKLQVESMQEDLNRMIVQKQKSTLAIALSLANDKSLIKTIEQNNIPYNGYSDLVAKLREHTLYKNVWIQIIDKNAVSIYRSWSTLKGDNLFTGRKDLAKVFADKKATYSINLCRFDLTMKSIVPIFDKKKFIGVLEVITHFNSIAENLKNSKIASVVVVKDEYKERITYPMTNIFIDDCYVANLNAPKELREYLKTHGIKNYLNNSYKIENGYIIVSHVLKDGMSKELGYYIMFKKISDINNPNLDFFTFKWIAAFVLLSLLILFTISNIFLIKNRNQKKYYRNILDTASNIVIVNDGTNIIDANKTFFKYFHNYTTLGEFLNEHKCVCEFFLEEEGYLHQEMGRLSWIEYILQHSDLIHKAKVEYVDNLYFFSITAALISKEKNHYGVVFTDITKEEQYQKELLDLSITDALTGIYNRHYFNQKIEEEVARAERYSSPLSLIMLDIDFFKRVNDEYGHAIGDKILVNYSKYISQMLRKTDTFCRTGGEEFIIILPYTALPEAEHLAQKLCQQIAEYKKILPITMSFGVAQFKKGNTVQAILKRVDDALYAAKESGRNRVVTN